MTLDDWFALLRDIDTLEKDCSTGFMGSYHVDVPRLASLPPLSSEEAYFYYQKARLYQGYGNDRWAGPFVTYMSYYMKSKNWFQFFLHYNQQKEICKDAAKRQNMISNELEEVTNVGWGTPTMHNLWHFDRHVNASIHDTFNNKDKHYNNITISEELGNYVNSMLTDYKWQQIINEAQCLKKAKKYHM